MTRAFRTLLIVALLLTAAACKKGNNTPAPSATEVPSASPASQSLADFQLVGRAQHAFVGVGPGIDTSQSPATTSTPGPTNASTATFASAPQMGVMRVVIDDASDALKSNCAAARDETINVFWTTATQFDTALLRSDLESSLEGSTVGVVGRIFTGQQASDLTGGASASPTGSPAATANASCVLVADQIGTSSGTIPTPRFRTTRTSAPTAAPTLRPTAPATTAPATTAPATTAPATTAPSPT